MELGMALAVVAVLSFTAWRINTADFGHWIAWLALAAAGCSFVLRGIGWYCAGRGDLDLYARPGIRASLILSWSIVPAALLGVVVSRRSYPLSVAALGLNAATLVLLAGNLRRARLTYRGLFSVVLAVYVLVLSIGRADPAMQYVLGLVAVLLALVFSTIGFVVRATATDDNGQEGLFAGPLFTSALTLTVLAIVPAYESPWTMLLAGLSFLVMVKGIPSRGWIYPAVASAACAVYFGALKNAPADRLVTAGMVGAYQLWLLGLFVTRERRSGQTFRIISARKATRSERVKYEKAAI